MTNRQVEELAKLFMDLGKLTFGTLILGSFQHQSNILAIFIVGIIGLTFSAVFFILGLRLFKQVK